MKSNMDEEIKRKAEALLGALDGAIASGSWNETNFILLIGKKLRAMRDDLSSQLKLAQEDPTSSSAFLSHQLAMQSTLKEVYIGLYSVEGVNLQSWENIVANLRRQMVSRPVYAKEDEIIAIIKTKEKKINEAYVSIFVSEADILSINADKAPIDKLGKSMLVLKDNAINLDNINFFMHLSGKYRYSRGRLVKINTADSAEA
ncbi:MAG: Dot/Icm secretion system protein IcmQ [Legionellaceae bacterium]|nr:Dot/Icm secretion system protein IcmQ [Legionellaceae bacterium]